MLCEENQPLGSSKAYLAGSDEHIESSDLGNNFLTSINVISSLKKPRSKEMYVFFIHIHLLPAFFQMNNIPSEFNKSFLYMRPFDFSL